MKKIITSIFCLFILGHALAQTSYKVLEAEGEIPERFLTKSSIKYEKEVENLKKENYDKEVEKELKKFKLESNFALDNLLHSGYVLFNDSITNYCKLILNKLIASESDLVKKNIKVYTYRSSIVNAFTSDRGDIFISIGLLARLENEAQLAFIMSHEITHYINKHSMETIVKDATFFSKKNKKNISKNVEVRDYFTNKTMFSQHAELEADANGAERYLKAGYPKNEIIKVFEILKKAEGFIYDEAFNYAILENGHYHLPQQMTSYQSKPYVYTAKKDDDGEEDDTHPKLEERILQIQKIISNIEENTKGNNLISYENIKKRAAFELANIYLSDQEYYAAIYASSILLKSHPNNDFLEEIIAQSLYRITKLSLESPKLFKVDDLNDLGHIAGVVNLFSELNLDEKIGLSFNYLANYINAHPQNKNVQLIFINLLEVVKTRHRALSNYQMVFTDSIKNQLKHPAPISQETKRNKDFNAETNYWNYALYLPNKHSNLDSILELSKAENFGIDNMYRDVNKANRKKAKALNISKILVLNPNYYRVDTRGEEDKLFYEYSEDGKYNMVNLVKRAAKASKLEVEILSATDLKKDEVDKFNDIRYLNDWINEKSEYFNGESYTPGVRQEEIKRIVQKYGTNEILITGVVSARVYNPYWIYVAPSLLVPGLGLISAYKALKPNYATYYYAYLYNVETGSINAIHSDLFKRKDSDDLIKAYIYDTFLQINSKSKKRKKSYYIKNRDIIPIPYQ